MLKLLKNQLLQLLKVLIYYGRLDYITLFLFLVPLQPIRAPPPVPPPAAPIQVTPVSPAPKVEENATLVELQRRQLLFKQAALSAKKSGDTENAVKYLRVSKASKYTIKNFLAG